jgi:hypothetical protein
MSRRLRPLSSKIPGSDCTKGPTFAADLQDWSANQAFTYRAVVLAVFVTIMLSTFLMVTKQLYENATPTVNDSDSINLQHEWRTAHTFTKYKPGCSIVAVSRRNFADQG